MENEEKRNDGKNSSPLSLLFVDCLTATLTACDDNKVFPRYPSTTNESLLLTPSPILFTDISRGKTYHRFSGICTIHVWH